LDVTNRWFSEKSLVLADTRFDPKSDLRAGFDRFKPAEDLQGIESALSDLAVHGGRMNAEQMKVVEAA
jgi:hypothetical protein